MRLVFIGPPGVGKGTQSERLTRHLKVTHLSTGDMLRHERRNKTDLGIKAETYMSAGQLVPDDLVLEIIGRRLTATDCRNGYLLDGFPRTLAQAEALDKMLAERGTPLDLVLELTAGADELVKRLAARGRSDDKPEVVRNRLQEYERVTAPLVDYYRQQDLLRSIDGEGTPDVVFARIRSAVDKPPLPAPETV